jgi:DNA-binding transcriptional regulator YiaG
MRILNRVRGQECYNAKLTPEAVKAIRENRKGLTDTKLAEFYGVTRTAIAKVRTYENWRHV